MLRSYYKELILVKIKEVTDNGGAITLSRVANKHIRGYLATLSGNERLLYAQKGIEISARLMTECSDISIGDVVISDGTEYQVVDKWETPHNVYYELKKD